MAEFRNSIRDLSAIVSAVDSSTGEKLPLRVWTPDSGEDLTSLVTSTGPHQQELRWITTEQKIIRVTAEGYSTQAFTVASSHTNIVAKLEKLK